MWENLKTDPFFRVVIVSVIGILALGLLLNLFSGQGGLLGFGSYPNGWMMNGGEHMSRGGAYGGGYGISFGSLVGGLLALLIKLLIFILVISIVIGIFTWIRNYMAKNNNTPWVQSVNSDPFLKTTGIITIAILVLVLASGIFSGFTGYGMGGGYSLAYGIAGLLAVLIKLLSYVLVISLIVAAVLYIKKHYESGNMNIFGTAKTATANVNINTMDVDKASTNVPGATNTDRTASPNTSNDFKGKK